jgi:hypothetical protein
MDPYFIGLIWSLFNTDKSTQVQQVQVTAFQSIPAGADHHLEELSSAEMEGLDPQMKAALRTSAAEHRGTKDSWVRREVPLSITTSSSSSSGGGGGREVAANPAPLSDLGEFRGVIWVVYRV